MAVLPSKTLGYNPFWLFFVSSRARVLVLAKYLYQSNFCLCLTWLSDLCVVLFPICFLYKVLVIDVGSILKQYDLI